MFSVSSKSNFNKTKSYLNNIKGEKLFANFSNYGKMGVDALNKATPVDTGITARSWGYRVVKNTRGTKIEWYNTNTDINGTPIPILIQYDHVSGTGGFVQGEDFINPAMRSVFDKIISDIRKKVKS